MLTTGLPTLSSIRAWGVEHLTDAADHWTATADRWENAFVQVWQQSRGLPWDGHGADALHERTHVDKTMVVGKADQLREAATVARRGASDISAAQRRVMYAVEDAHSAGFTVGEDLSVTDTHTSRDAVERAARQAQAQVFAADIRHRTAALVGVDNEVGGNLTETAGDVGNTAFAEKPIMLDGNPIHVDVNPRNGTIQLVGHGFKGDGPPPPPQPHAGYPIKLSPRTTPPPPTVITAAPPDAANTPDHGGVGFPKCKPEDVLGDGIEIVAGGLLTAASVPVEGATLGLGGLAGLTGGGGLVYDGVKGLEECK